MIKLHNVTKIYDGSTKAVDNISFEIKEGETFGLIGTSGCGKTTTLKMINRLVEPDSGEITVSGRSVLRQPAEELRRNIGYVIQSVGLFPHYSVRENIETVPRLMHWDEDKVQQRSEHLLQLVGLDPAEFAHRTPDALSGGQQQRIGLARALAADPKVLLMDEPFGALDPITKEQVREEFKKLLAQLNKTVILVTHDVEEAFELCDRICLMDQGKAQQTGTPKELLFKPVNKFVESFFDAHRFQLELMSVSVGEVIGYKKKDSASFDGGTPLEKGGGDDIYLAQSLQDVFEISGSEIEKYRVLNSNEEIIDQITISQLIEGFQQLRRKLKGGQL